MRWTTRDKDTMIGCLITMGRRTSKHPIALPVTMWLGQGEWVEMGMGMEMGSVLVGEYVDMRTHDGMMVVLLIHESMMQPLFCSFLYEIHAHWLFHVVRLVLTMECLV